MIGDLFLKYFNSHKFSELEFAYDEDENEVECECCRQRLFFKDGEYYCAECDKVISRQEFFNYIGAEPPGSECYNCDNNYPVCSICQYGYVDDDDEDDYDEYYDDDEDDEE